MAQNERCRNMNHGRMQVQIRFCPTCGDVLNRAAIGRCDHGKHAELRRGRHAFCHDCGKGLATLK